LNALNHKEALEKIEKARVKMIQTTKVDGFDHVFDEYGVNMIAAPLDSMLSSMAAAAGSPPIPIESSATDDCRISYLYCSNGYLES
jgi:hypothetical protein